MVEEFITTLKEFSINEIGIKSVIVVGSYARGKNTETSDLDLCIITNNKKQIIDNLEFIKKFGEFNQKQLEYYGACTSIRVWYKNGLEVEFGIVEPSWISLPLDDGTRKVLSDGYKVIIDKEHYFQNLEF